MTPAMTDSPPPPDETLRPALEALSAIDDDLARAYEVCGLPPVRPAIPGFPGLLRIICAQQLSIHATRAIMGRLQGLARPMTAKKYLALDDGALRKAGLSRQKITYSRALAEDLGTRRLDLGGLARLDDDGAVAHLTRVKGIGDWSAHMYLLFAMGRPDIWPVGDLAVCLAAKKLKRWRQRPTPDRMHRLGKPWRPHRSAAARFLWHYYRHPGVG